MGGDLLHSKGYNVTINGLNLNQLAILVYGVQRAFMFFARIQKKNQKTCKLRILQWKIYEPKEQ